MSELGEGRSPSNTNACAENSRVSFQKSIKWSDGEIPRGSTPSNGLATSCWWTGSVGSRRVGTELGVGVSGAIDASGCVMCRAPPPARLRFTADGPVG